MTDSVKPWPALWALVVGFFMILVDSTIVSVANPAILRGLQTDINAVIWVTSAYLLAYAVPLLITGRLGDRFGPKNIYLLGLVLFTLSSLWCGFAGDINMLILARVVQGLGASMMTPQTMSVITRTFPPEGRGQALGLWGAVAGVATLVGPVLGGVLVDTLGWEWIFFINVPVGVIAFVLAWRLVPRLPVHSHRFDLFGVVLSAVGMFLIVFGIQEGETYDWGTITGPISVWSLIIAGLVIFAGFLFWQTKNKREPLLPLELFRDRNFSLSSLAIAAVGFAVTSMALPLMFYAQSVRGLTPTQAALLMVPMAVITGVLAPFVGKLVDRTNPKYIAAVGLLLLGGSLLWLGSLLTPDMPIWVLLFPFALLGVANAGIWSPLASSATRNLPGRQAGAGSGVYNTTRQVGAVLGSAGIAALMQSRLLAELPGIPGGGQGGSGVLPESLHAGFSAAMGQSMVLPAVVAMVGFVAVLFYAKPSVIGRPADVREAGTDVREPAADVREASADPAESPVPPSS